MQITASLMAFLMSAIITAVISLLSFGFSTAALAAFVHKWPLGFIVAWPTAVVVLPLVRRFVDRITA